jgi:hypothetical protein
VVDLLVVDLLDMLYLLDHLHLLNLLGVHRILCHGPLPLIPEQSLSPIASIQTHLPF